LKKSDKKSDKVWQKIQTTATVFILLCKTKGVEKQKAHWKKKIHIYYITT